MLSRYSSDVAATPPHPRRGKAFPGLAFSPWASVAGSLGRLGCRRFHRLGDQLRDVLFEPCDFIRIASENPSVDLPILSHEKRRGIARMPTERGVDLVGSHHDGIVDL